MGPIFVTAFFTILSYLGLRYSLYLEEKGLVIFSGIATGFNLCCFVGVLFNLF